MPKTTSSNWPRAIAAAASLGWIGVLILAVLTFAAGCATAPARYEVFHVAGSAYSAVTRDGRALAPGTYAVGLDEATGTAIVFLRDGTTAPARVISVPGRTGQARFTVAPARDGTLVVTQQ